MEKEFHVYILASQRNGTLYIGVTSNLIQRVWQHRSDVVEGFTRQHGVHRLVWFEAQPDARSAVMREKQLKEWKRAWKLALIEAANPTWRDLYGEIVG
ncbi:GIY-YIG nuclease family protein [Nevskia sp.]|uniref:GIY-YIG nuclease family protein n=1 Tax=Nevskia sp. TaxID=1929292 RepID=UPI0025E6AA69|nr:GIY-YIG nuclease family protein [Nevskia sp.]